MNGMTTVAAISAPPSPAADAALSGSSLSPAAAAPHRGVTGLAPLQSQLRPEGGTAWKMLAVAESSRSPTSQTRRTSELASARGSTTIDKLASLFANGAPPTQEDL